MVPTRELCLQVSGDLATAAKHLTADDDRRLSVVSIYGGRPYEPQIEALRVGADVVVGTPGRLLDLAQQGHLQLGGLSVLVLDEADEMLDLGFLPDIERILRQIPDERQSMLFSATMPDPIITLARTFMNQPTHIRAEAPHSSAVHDTTEQYVYRAHALDKVELVSRVLQARGRGATMIFTRTKRTAQKVADDLAERGFAVGAVHGDLGQVAREKALKAFRTGVSTCWWPPTWPLAASTSTTSPTSSTTRSPRTNRPTFTASAAPAAPAGPGSRSRSSTGTSWPAGR